MGIVLFLPCCQVNFGKSEITWRRKTPALRDRLAHCKGSSANRACRFAASSAAGPVAQWLEPAAHNGLVAGSSPAGPTIFCLSKDSQISLR